MVIGCPTHKSLHSAVCAKYALSMQSAIHYVNFQCMPCVFLLCPACSQRGIAQCFALCHLRWVSWLGLINHSGKLKLPADLSNILNWGGHLEGAFRHTSFLASYKDANWRGLECQLNFAPPPRAPPVLLIFLSVWHMLEESRPPLVAWRIEEQGARLNSFVRF